MKSISTVTEYWLHHYMHDLTETSNSESVNHENLALFAKFLLTNPKFAKLRTVLYTQVRRHQRNCLANMYYTT